MSPGSPPRLQLGDWDDALLDGVDLVVKSPGVPNDAPPDRAAQRPGHPDHLRDRARCAAAPEPDPRRHRHERQDDDDGAPRRDVRRRRDPGRGGREHRPAADEPRRRRRPGRVDRLRALVLPARGRRHAAPADRDAAQPRARPPRPARQLRGVQRRQAAHLREPGRDDIAIVPRGFGPVPGAARRIEFDGDDAAARRAADPRSPQPRERGRGRRGSPRRRASPTTRSPRRCARSPASSTGSRRSRRSPACATSTTRRRRTSPQRSARSPRSPARGSS